MTIPTERKLITIEKLRQKNANFDVNFGKIIEFKNIIAHNFKR